jgi:transcriptional regulator with XRE-family HTH domain
MDIEKRNLTDVERFEQSSTESRRLLNQEKLILEVTEALSEAIEERGITRSEVAKRLGKTKGFVSQLLAGGRNLTLRTVADIADAIGISLRVEVQRAESTKGATRSRRMDVSVQTAASWTIESRHLMRRQSDRTDLHYSIHGQIGQSSAANAEQWAA